MTLHARRWYYSIAILIFLVTAPLIVANAAGWRWNGWRLGFAATGTLIVTGEKRLSVTLNGQSVGTTPKRISGLTPGVYRLTLSRPGYQDWAHLVTIAARTTTNIGPVRIFPATLSTTVLSPDQFAGFVIDPTATAVAGWTSTPTGVNVRLLWPPIETIFPVNEPPTWVRISPRRQRVAIGSASGTRIYLVDNPTSVQTLPAGEPITWLTSSESIVYRLEAGQVVADDVLTANRTSVAIANTMAVLDDTIWYTSQVSDVTNLYQRSDATASTAKLVATLNGEWRLVGRVGRSMVISETTSGQARLVRINRLTSRVDQVILGGLTDIADNRTDTAPLWLNGADVVTLSPAQEAIVLLRSTEELRQAVWIDPGHLLATLSASQFSIRSLSSRQGRSTLLTTVMTDQQRPLIIDLAAASIFVDHDGRLERWQWK